MPWDAFGSTARQLGNKTVRTTSTTNSSAITSSPFPASNSPPDRKRSAQPRATVPIDSNRQPICLPPALFRRPNQLPLSLFEHLLALAGSGRLMIHSDSDAPTLVSSTKSVLHPSLLQSESMTALATMVGGNKAVMKRNTRAFVGDKIEQALLGPQSEKMTKEDEKADVEPHRKGSIGTSTNQSSRSSRQTSLECSPMTATTSLDTDLSDLSKDEHFSLPDALRDIEPPHAVQAYSHSAKAPLRPNPTLPLIPSDGRPKNFGVVVPGVYRSSFPQSEDYPFIEGLKLKTMVLVTRFETLFSFSTY